MRDPINPKIDGFILDVKRLRMIIQDAHEDAEIVLRCEDGDCHILMEELEVYSADSSHPANLAHPNWSAYVEDATLIIDLVKVGTCTTGISPDK